MVGKHLHKLCARVVKHKNRSSLGLIHIPSVPHRRWDDVLRLPRVHQLLDYSGGAAHRRNAHGINVMDRLSGRYL